MALSIDGIPAWLRRRGLIGRAARDVTVTREEHRNVGFRVRRRGRPGLFLKQAGGEEPWTEETVRLEAHFYQLCAADARLAPLVGCLPRYVAWDGEVLATELLVDARPLFEGRSGEVIISPEPAAALGRALGALHGIPHEALSALRLPTTAPAMVELHRPGPEVFAELSPAQESVLRIVQGDAPLTAHLDRMRHDWAPGALSHGDIRRENVLVRGGGDAIDLRIIDWECVHWGDPAWDVGAALASALALWLRTLPSEPGADVATTLAGAAIPLPVVRRAFRALWTNYRSTAELDAREVGVRLRRATGACAVRMVQAAWEEAADVAALCGHEVALLRIASSIAADLEGATFHLFGIPLPWPP